MSAATASVDWTEANKALLGTELAWLRWRIESASDGGAGHDEAALQDAMATASSAMPQPSSLDIVCRLFGLSAFERHLLALCSGIELDTKLADACARAHRDEARRYATFGLALAALPEAHWSALSPHRPLRRWHLVDLEAGSRLVDSPLRVDERILHFIAGINQIDVRLRPLLVEALPPRLMSPAQRTRATALAERFADAERPLEVLQFDGGDPAGQQDMAAEIAALLGRRLFVVRGEDLPATGLELEQFRTLWERESLLLPALLLARNTDHTTANVLALLVETLQVPLLVASREPLRTQREALAATIDKPEAGEQKELWLQALGDTGASLNGSLDMLSGQFRLSAGTIASIADGLASFGVANGIEKEMWTACRRHGRSRLDDLAERLAPRATWDDLVLPAGQQNTLRQVAAHLRQRNRVQNDWGFSGQGARGMGVSALFCGESGTGKTLAAEVLANELRLDLYRIDLSAVVSKYIGETEKNLRRVFDAAEDSGAILLFDEADALFGKRSEVKDSHDRYANIEVSYLLQRMEAYSGLAVLTTNMKSALDRAFQRRLRFIVNFPFPDAELREEIWRRVFPARAPLHDLDYRKLARLNLPGGNIRNIALNAAFLAADACQPLAMGHLLRAAQSESAKLERPLAEAETRGWT